MGGLALNERDAQTALRAVPGFRFASVRPVVQGWANWAFEVDGAWVARFPRSAAAAHELRKEMALLPALGAILPCAVPQPVFTGTYRDRPFVVYRRIDGRPPDHLDPVRDGPLCRSLGAALADLHGAPLERARALTGAGQAPTAWRAAHRRLRLRARGRLAGVVDGATCAALETAFEAFEAALAFAPALVHGDLNPEHILLDEAGALAGIIDWGDATVGDPAVDFAGIQRVFGAEAVAAVLAAYDAPRDLGIAMRAGAYAWMGDLRDLLHELGARREESATAALGKLRRRLGTSNPG